MSEYMYCDDINDPRYGLRRIKNVMITSTDPVRIVQLRQRIIDGEIDWFVKDGVRFKGYVTDVHLCTVDGEPGVEATVRPTGAPEPTYGRPQLTNAYVTMEEADAYYRRQAEGRYDRCRCIWNPIDGMDAKPLTIDERRLIAANEIALRNLTDWYTADFAGEKFWKTGQLPITQEKVMKVFEAIVVRVEKKDGVLTPTSVVKVVGPFIAESANDAARTVMFDYGKAENLEGKDLAGYQVRVREFCSVI